MPSQNFSQYLILPRRWGHTGACVWTQGFREFLRRVGRVLGNIPPMPRGSILSFGLSLVVVLLSGCTPSSPASVIVVSSPPTVDSSPPSDEEPVTGVVGMVRPTKDGYFVGDVVVDNDMLSGALATDPARKAKDPDWFLGAVVRVEADVQHHEVPAAAAQDPETGAVAQTRMGSWKRAAYVKSAKVIVPAAVIEGTIGRSKGFFVVAGRLVDRADLAWALAPDGGQEGVRVRLYGQFRTQHCEPDAQCLIEGSLPLFDVGRAVRLP